MKISEIDKLKVGDDFTYKSFWATILWKRDKDNKMSIGPKDEDGNDAEDKAICLRFKYKNSINLTKFVTLTSRLDSKCVKNGALYELELEDYER